MNKILNNNCLKLLSLPRIYSSFSALRSMRWRKASDDVLATPVIPKHQRQIVELSFELMRVDLWMVYGVCALYAVRRYSTNIFRRHENIKRTNNLSTLSCAGRKQEGSR